MDLDQLAALRTPEGLAALAAAAALAGGDPLAAVSALRAAGHPPELSAAAFTQALLRARAESKFGPAAHAMFFTRAGLEQATRSVVAARRAARLKASGVRHAVDLCCGLGADALAMARAGLRVRAVDADPLTAALAAANAEAVGLAGLVEVVCAEASTVDLSGADAVFCDPARRTGSGSGGSGRSGDPGGRRVFDPRSYSPPWDFVVGLARTVPATVLKVGPGVDHALIPEGAEAQWVSVDGDVVEAALWFGPLATGPRRATLLRSTGEVAELTGPGTAATPVGPARRYLYDPAGAVVRAHLVAEFASTVDATLADGRIAYCYGDTPVATPFARCFEVTHALPFSLKKVRALLRDLEIGVLEIRKRGSPLEPDQLRRDLRLAGGRSATLVLTRVADAPTALICQPVVSTG